MIRSGKGRCGFEIPYVFDIPAAHVADKVTDADKAMAALASAYWVSFGKTADPNWRSAGMAEA